MDKQISRRRLLSFASAASVAGVLPRTAAATAAAASFPNHPLRLIVGFPPGGITDQVMRVAAVDAEKKLGQPVIIENRPGAAGVTSFLLMKNAAPDGYTIGQINTSLWRQPVFTPVDYDPMRDFTYIINLVDNIFAVVVNAESPFKSWSELLAYGKANQNRISYGAPPGLGQSAHLFVEEIAAKEHVSWQAIGYKGSSESMTALLGGQIDFSVDTVISSSAFVRAGKARYLAVAANQRMQTWPDVPTMRDLGYQLSIDSPIGLGGPARMPPEVVASIHDAFKFALEQPAMTALLQRADQHARYMGTAEFTAFVARSNVEQRELLTRFGMANKR
ncbi:Argininosuccinate lyase [Variovorax sp. SRS16]|uniref:tripartite tricarboxylate transporter substrate binding protein n=1 Tax=Variovorax sp. SRS16 TaxID=282217 RepID=UPI0013180260|nr:tripartite tricarboxylate transporter substrate binding protein [Variovorax sp. SRS16]VTU13185.1 Argininosuccinate lyase [Variovorax sp. SRS16]